MVLERHSECIMDGAACVKKGADGGVKRDGDTGASLVHTDAL